MKVCILTYLFGASYRTIKVHKPFKLGHLDLLLTLRHNYVRLHFRSGDGDSSQKAKVDEKRQLSIFWICFFSTRNHNADRLFLRIIFLFVDNIFNNRYFEYKFLHVVFVSIFFSLCFLLSYQKMRINITKKENLYTSNG